MRVVTPVGETPTAPGASELTGGAVVLADGPDDVVAVPLLASVEQPARAETPAATMSGAHTSQHWWRGREKRRCGRMVPIYATLCGVITLCGVMKCLGCLECCRP